MINESSLRFPQGALKVIYDNETEQIEFLAGQTNLESSFQMSHRPFYVNKSLIVDDQESSFKTDGEYILVNRNDSDIIMRLLSLGANQKKIKIIDGSEDHQTPKQQNEDDLQKAGDSPLLNQRTASVVMHQPIKDNVFQKAQITTLNEQFHQESNLATGRLTTLNQKNSILTKNHSSLIRISSRYINNEFSDDELFLAEDQLLNQLSKGMKLQYLMQTIQLKQKFQAFNRMKAFLTQTKVLTIARLVDILQRKSTQNSLSTFYSIKIFGVQKLLGAKVYESQRQQARKQSQGTNKNIRSSYTYDEEVSEVMEENIRESDLDILDKNSKVSNFQASNLLSQKIGDQSSYLVTHSRYMNGQTFGDFNTTASNHQRIHSMNTYFFKGNNLREQYGNYNQTVLNDYDPKKDTRNSHPIRSIIPAGIQYDNSFNYNNRTNNDYITSELDINCSRAQELGARIIQRIIRRLNQKLLQRKFQTFYKNSKQLNNLSSLLEQAPQNVSPKGKLSLLIRHQSPPLVHHRGEHQMMIPSKNQVNSNSQMKIDSQHKFSFTSSSSSSISKLARKTQNLPASFPQKSKQSSPTNNSARDKNLSISRLTSNKNEKHRGKKEVKPCICKIEVGKIPLKKE